MSPEQGQVSPADPPASAAPARTISRPAARAVEGRHRSRAIGEAVVVGRGVVGDRVVRRLQQLGHSVRVGDERTAASAEHVVLCHPGPHAELVAQLLTGPRTIVTVADDLDDVRRLLRLRVRSEQVGARLVLGAALSPGLSGLLARLLAAEMAVCDEIHVAIHGTAGPSCARQHHRALAGRAIGFHDGDWIYPRAGTGRELCWFPEPVGAYDCYRAELPSPLLLAGVFPGIQRITARMSATRRDRLTSRLPMLTPPHAEGGVGALRVELRGRRADGAQHIRVVGIAEQVGTAAAATAVAFADAAINGAVPVGIVVAGDDRLDTVGLLHSISRLGVRLQDFTGEITG